MLRTKISEPGGACMSPSIPRAVLTIVAALLIALSALYLTILLHELGHAGAAFALGCDDAFSRLTVKMSVVGPSFGAAIDEACLARAPRWSLAAVGIAGVIVNLCLMFASWGAGRAMSRPALASVWLQAFAAANFVEAFSYLVANTALPRTDMIPVLQFTGIPNLVAAGVCAAAAVAIGVPLYRRLAAASARVAPAALARWLIATLSILMAAGMVVGRLKATG